MRKLITIIISLYITGICNAQESNDYELLQMQSSPFSVEDNYLSKHDIVYFSPTQLEAEGFPLGNGDMGGMIWNNPNGIELQINKNDLWTNPILSKEKDSEGNLSVLKHAVRLKIDFGIPVFNWIHMDEFTGRLSLQKGEASFKAKTAYSKTQINSWIAQDENVWVIECENIPTETKKPITATVSMERLGSRSFSGWYAGGFPKDAKAGMGKTEARIKGTDMIICETGNGLNFAVACRIINENNVPVVISNHRLEQKTQAEKFTILISVATDRECKNPIEASVKLLDNTIIKGISQLKEEKENWQKRFWSNSFVKLGNDYIENIYYLRRYLMGAGSLGEFPVAFNGGLWRWNRDVMNWVIPHHWNTQQQYWGLCAQNDCQLLLPYLNTYYKMIPSAQKLAMEKGASDEAILLTEAHSFWGDQVTKNRSDMKNNFTPASQVASIFWDYYDFTGDKTFLKNKGYVFMKKAAQFYLDRLQWDETKKEYFLMSSLYESANIDHVKNSLSDRNCIEQLFTNCIKAAELLKTDRKKIKEWKYVLDHLWKRSYEMIDDKYEVIAPAEEYFTETRYNTWNWACGGMVAFPCNLVGIDNKDSRIGKAIINYLKTNQNLNAHYPVPEIAARIGEGDEAEKCITKGLQLNQIYPQGLMHNVTGYPDNIYNLASVHDLLNHAYTIRSQEFFQCGMEPISNYATAINEMMLQSNEGKIRIFPAIPKTWDSTNIAFTLLARGAFIVSSEMRKNAIINQVGIKSLQGNLCKIQNPWPDNTAISITSDNKPIKYRIDKNDVILFETKKDKEYVVKLKSNSNDFKPNIYRSKPNMQVKRLGKCIIGKISGWNDNLY